MAKQKYEPLDKELKQKWVEALRSGEYKQGKYDLVNLNEEYCCLGVLCAVSGLKRDVWEDNVTIGLSIMLQEEKLSPLSDTNASDILITMNDEEGKSFEEIADWIDKNL